ncbi:histidine triad nucleotide-binding protein [Candidatus Margulisiibacteriota bacterium]
MTYNKDCLFCKIAQGQIPAEKVYEDEHVLAFNDINSQAPIHILVIPKSHIRNILEITQGDTQELSALIAAIKKITAEKEIQESGFRVVANTGPNAGQEVDHLHFHILGGRPMSWPPG